MQKAALALLLGLALVPVTDAEATSVSFSAPADLEAESMAVQDLQWALLVFRDGATGGLSVGDLGAHDQATTGFVRSVHVMQGSQPEVRPKGSWDNSSRAVPRLDSFEVSFDGQMASLYIEATRISLNATPTMGQLDVIAASEGTAKFERRDDRIKELYLDHPVSGDQVVSRLSPGAMDLVPMTLLAEGVRFVEWYNASVECAGGDCPSGGGPSITKLATAAGYTVQSERFNYSSLSGDLGSMVAHGAVDYFVGGGGSIAAQIDGRLRLPLAQGPLACPSCISPNDQTLTLKGMLHLDSLQPQEQRIQGQVGGRFDQAALDETPIDPALLTGTTATVAAAAAAGLFVLKLLLAPLFTRLSREEALEHPRRRAIFEHVQRNPGTSFRETARVVGIAAGTVRHHLNVLQRSGMVVERPHGATMRFFETNGKNDADWVEVVMLREPALRLLFDWLKGHPRSPQTAVLEAMEAHGWSRSTTQHRLSRLVDAGLVSIKLQGRYKMYSVADRPKPDGNGRPNPMPAPAPSPS